MKAEGLRPSRILLLTSSGLLLCAIPFLPNSDRTIGGTPVSAAAEAAMTAESAEAPPDAAPQPEEEAPPRPADRPDEAVKLLLALQKSTFESPGEVATGRFLAEIAQKGQFVKGIDLKKLRALSHGPRRARIAAEYRPERYWYEKQEEPRTMTLDIVLEKDRWKLEDLQIIGRSEP